MSDVREPGVYSEKVRLDAIAKVEKHGLAEATRITGLPKSTIHMWCQDAGVATASEEQRQRTEAATQASVLARKAQVAESNSRLTVLLATIAELGARCEIDILRKRLEGKGEVRLHEIVGARTRAVHDLALINGEATERAEVVDSPDTLRELQNDLRERLAGDAS